MTTPDEQFREQLKKFFPTSCDVSNLLEKFYEETPIVGNSYDDFLKLPVSDAYRKRQQEKEAETGEDKPSQIECSVVPEKSCLA